MSEESSNKELAMALSKKKRSKIFSDEELKGLDREALEDHIRQLSAHNIQLQALLRRTLAKGSTLTSKHEDSSTKKIQRKKDRPFDFSKHTTRHILLQFLYLGWDHQGYAVQEDTLNTIETILFDALDKTKLIQDRQTSNYHRCGRTDKGVSAFAQVISLSVRSKLKEDEWGTRDHLEIRYVELLNRVLPKDIRMIAWSPAPPDFSARFDCTSRTYKYFFPRGSLDLQRMREAGQLLTGSHDFRNLCKMDVGNGVVSFQRTVDSVTVSLLSDDCQLPARRQGPGSDSVLSGSSRGEADNHTSSHNADGGMNCAVCGHVGPSEGATDSCSHGVWLKQQDDSFTEGGPEIESSSDTSNHKSLPNGGTTTPLSSSHTHNNSRTGGSCSPSSNLCVAQPLPSVDHTSTSGSKTESEEDSDSSMFPGSSMCVVTVVSKAFLWHQIRAMMAVLLLVGEGLEQPNVVQELMDVQRHPRKPQYSLASELPLCLFATEYPSHVVQWRRDSQELRRLETDLQQAWAQHSIRAGMIQRMLAEVSSQSREMAGGEHTPMRRQHMCLTPAAQPRQYKPLLQRHTCDSLEAKVKHYVKRRRLDSDVLSNVTTVGAEAADRSDATDADAVADAAHPEKAAHS